MKQTDHADLPDDDYALIEAAVMETARGRWFLSEYARRNRAADTEVVLEALARLERGIGAPRSSIGESIRLELVDMASAIARTKAEIAALSPDGANGGRIVDATNELDAIVKATETATGEILAAAEHLQEVAWTMREAGVEGAACEIIDQRATDIYMACSFQDITGQRTQKVIQVLRYLEQRLDSMIKVWGSSDVHVVDAGPPPLIPRGDGLLNGPALPGQGLDQQDVDTMMGYRPPVAESVTPPVALLECEPPSNPLPEPLSAVADAPAASREAQPPLAIEPVAENVTARPVEVETAVARPVPMVEPPAIFTAPEPAPSPFTPVNKPKPRAKAGSDAKADGGPTLDDVDALGFEEKAALFS